MRVRFPRRGLVSIYRWHFLFQRGGPCSRSKQAYEGEDYLRMYFIANTDASASAVRSSDAEVVRVWALRCQNKFYVYAFIFECTPQRATAYMGRERHARGTALRQYLLFFKHHYFSIVGGATPPPIPGSPMTDPFPI